MNQREYAKLKLTYNSVELLTDSIYLCHGGPGLTNNEAMLYNTDKEISLKVMRNTYLKSDTLGNKCIMTSGYTQGTGSIRCIIHPKTFDLYDVFEAYLVKTGFLLFQEDSKLGVRTVTGKIIIPAIAKRIHQITSSKIGIDYADGSGLVVKDFVSNKEVKLEKNTCRTIEESGKFYTVREDTHRTIDLADWQVPFSLFTLKGKRLTKPEFVSKSNNAKLKLTVLLYGSRSLPSNKSGAFLLSTSGNPLGNTYDFFEAIVWGTGITLGKTSPHYSPMPSTWWKLDKSTLAPIEAMKDINEQAILSSAIKVWYNQAGGYHG